MAALKRVDIQLSNHAFDLPYIVAKEQGFFAEQGLDVHFAEGEPFITMAEKAGCHLLCEGFFLGSDIGSETMEESVYERITVAMRVAVKLINGDKRRFLHHILADPELQDMPDQPEYPRLTEDDFNLSRLRYIEPQPYPHELFVNTYNWMQSWDLVSAQADWDRVADNRGPAAEVEVGR